jgi:hypothetical protein
MLETSGNARSTDSLRGLPKAEAHVHLEGCFEPATLQHGLEKTRRRKIGHGEIRIGCKSRPSVRPRFKEPSETRQSGRQCFACLRRQRLKPNQIFAQAADNAAANCGLN